MKKKKWMRWMILLLILLLLANAGNITRLFFPVRYRDYVETYASQYQVDPYLIMSIIKAESNFEVNAVSHKQANGLMQITEPTARWLADRLKMTNFHPDDLTDPAINIQLGCYYFSYLLAHYQGNTENALAAYNAGQGTVDKWLTDSEYSKDCKTLSAIPYPETRQYIIRVTNYHKFYSLLYQPENQA